MNIFQTQSIDHVGAGDLLISEPLLPDFNFSRSVVLICEEKDDTHFGFVINKSLKESCLEDMISDVETFHKEVYLGGPVDQNYLQCIYKGHSDISNSLELKNGFFWGGDFDEIIVKIKSGEADIDDFWFFLGYSAWGPGQLRDELEENSWLVCQWNLSDYMSIPEDQKWKRAILSLGKEYELMSRFPADSRLN